MKRGPMILNGLLGRVAAILAFVTMGYVSQSFSLLLAVLSYFFISILEDILKLLQISTKNISKPKNMKLF